MKLSLEPCSLFHLAPIVSIFALSAACPALAGDGTCPAGEQRTALVTRLGDFARRSDELRDGVRDMVSQAVARNPGSLDLGELASQIQLDPVARFEDVFGAHREAAFQLQRSEDAACSRYRPFGATALERDATQDERNSCLRQLRSGEAPADNYPGHADEPLRRVRSYAFRKQALSWTMFSGRLTRWSLRFRKVAADVRDGMNRNDLEDFIDGINEMMAGINQRDWSQPPNKASLRARFDQFKLDLLNLRFDVDEMRSVCQSWRPGSSQPPMIPIQNNGAEPAH